MIDTPFETWCANVAHLLVQTWILVSPRGATENAVDYLCRVFGADQVSEAYAHDQTPAQFAATGVPLA